MDFKIILITILIFLIIIGGNLIFFLQIPTSSYIFIGIFIPGVILCVYFIFVLFILRYQQRDTCYNMPFSKCYCCCCKNQEESFQPINTTTTSNTEIRPPPLSINNYYDYIIEESDKPPFNNYFNYDLYKNIGINDNNYSSSV